jgi:hypothetical protein
MSSAIEKYLYEKVSATGQTRFDQLQAHFGSNQIDEIKSLVYQVFMAGAASGYEVGKKEGKDK